MLASIRARSYEWDMLRGIAGAALDLAYRHRARWSARRLLPWLEPGARVLDIGAGDCHLGVELQRHPGCTVVAVDVHDSNRTALPLRLYDGRTLPFADRSFDAGLLLFVLHHADDPRTLLREARRTCSRLIVFEDLTAGRWNRTLFRWSHRCYERLFGVEYPRREWDPARWSALAQETGLAERWSAPLGHQGGFFVPRHIMYVWEPAQG
jgi:ubiquinone/menaquinone biosynthesis C-methylase UbiE